MSVDLTAVRPSLVPEVRLVAVPAQSEPPIAAPASATRWRPQWWLRLLLLGVTAAGATVALRGRLPDPAAVTSVASSADLRWAIVALVAQVVSMTMFAHQQRHLLRAFGVGMSTLRALAVTYSRTAISMVLPAGGAVSAAFAFEQYRHRGASRATAATVMVLSGVASVAGLVVLYLAGVLAAADSLTPLWTEHAVGLGGIALLVLAAGALVAWSTHPTTRRTAATRTAATRTVAAWPVVDRARRQVANLAHDARTVPARQWLAVVGYAAANWLFDLVCLAAVAHACHLELGYGALASVFLAVQIVRQLPVTPGGFGLIEASLLAGLVAAGAPTTTAATVVLGYRLISFWLVLPVGLATYLGLRRSGPDPTTRSTTSPTMEEGHLDEDAPPNPAGRAPCRRRNGRRRRHRLARQ